ncbi:MAG TPA: M23 family metallopeptidase [Kofleriaceae bacterium]|nr:M23 family metallopeptidase [Kofleriaceae bacterium]
MLAFDPISLALDPPRFVKKRPAPKLRVAGPPVWPLPELNGRAPVILRAWQPREPGVKLAYARRDADDLIATYPPDSPHGTAAHFMPSSIPVFCVNDGEVIHAGEMLEHGHLAIVDHGNGWATYYGNLEHLFVTPTKHLRKPVYVKAGDALGFAGSTRPNGFKCLHFELWRSEKNMFVDTEPTQYMRDWRVLPLRSAYLTPDEPRAADLAA